MAIVQMQKVAILAHHELRDAVIRHLHERGVMQVCQAEGVSDVDHTEANFRMAELHFAIQTLTSLASKELVAAAQKPAKPQDVIHAAQHTDVRGIVDTLHTLEEDDTQAQRDIAELSQAVRILAPWINLPVALNAPIETRRTVRMLGTVPEAHVQEFAQDLASTRSMIETVSVQDGSAHIMAAVWKDDVRTFEEIATRRGWTNVQLPSLHGMASHLHADASARLRAAEERIAQNAHKRMSLTSHLPNLVKTDIFIRWLKEEQGVREAMGGTKNTVTILGWIPSSDLHAMEEGLKRLSPAIAVLKVKADEGEEAPVLLKHKKLVAPFISVTTLYGLPLPTEMDPTAALSPFFILFFALCLTDAGYGLALFVIFSIALLKMKRSVNEEPLLWLLWMSGLVSILVGIPFGGWFGLTPDKVPEFLTKTATDGTPLFKGQIWNLSQQSGITFLQNLALALGLTHLFFGMFLAGYHKWVHGNKAAAFWLDFTSHILFAAIGFYIAAPLFTQTENMSQLAAYVLYASIALAIWGKGYGSVWYLRPIFGLLALVNLAIAMLSNGLSYLRILALGLVTGAMALAVNQVAIEMGKLFPIWIGIPVIVLIFTLGHLVSIALNTLGSFIHSGRLQFIEFFSQFFEGGGKPYAPFRRSTL